MRLFLLLITWVYVIQLSSQFQFLELNSVWDDNYSEWEITFEDDEEEIRTGYIQRKWPLGNNWEEWTYDLGDSYGEIKTKWKGQLDTWELRGDNKIVEMRKRWRNDVNEWVVIYNGFRVIMNTEYHDDANSWNVNDRSVHFAMYTQYINDPRDWVIEDEYLSLDREHRLALIFISLIHSIPK